MKPLDIILQTHKQSRRCEQIIIVGRGERKGSHISDGTAQCISHYYDVIGVSSHVPIMYITDGIPESMATSAPKYSRLP